MLGDTTPNNNRANSYEFATHCSKNLMLFNLICHSYLPYQRNELFPPTSQTRTLRHREIKLGRNRASFELWDTGFKSES